MGDYGPRFGLTKTANMATGTTGERKRMNTGQVIFPCPCVYSVAIYSVLAVSLITSALQCIPDALQPPAHLPGKFGNTLFIHQPQHRRGIHKGNGDGTILLFTQHHVAGQ